MHTYLINLYLCTISLPICCMSLFLGCPLESHIIVLFHQRSCQYLSDILYYNGNKNIPTYTKGIMRLNKKNVDKV